MYLPALKNAIQHLEEKAFYQVALMYLSVLGYQELSIVDGTGDGGRDVVCSRGDLRIQLSVRKDWDKKINEEAQKTLDENCRHLIYVTNKIISPLAEQEFLQGKYAHKGDVDVSVHDLRRITTALAQPGVIRRAYELLNMAVPATMEATVKEIALSTVLLFSEEARELRDSVIEANVRAQLLKAPGISESSVIQRIAETVPGVNVERAARSALSRLRNTGRVIGQNASLQLSDSEQTTMEAAATEFLVAVEADVSMLSGVTGLSKVEARQLLDIALELLLRNRDLNGTGPVEESLRNFLAAHNLTRQRAKIFDALSRTASATFKEHGETIDRMFALNSFDIYRALGRRTDISIVLDSSVAMPVIFGLEFGAAKSRYGVAALALRDACKAHNIRMVVPRCYVNEMAAHGHGALEKLEIYSKLPEEARTSLRASGNAYLSHYTHISETMRESGEELSLEKFLGHFGVVQGRPLSRIENRITSILEQHDISCLLDGRYDQPVFNRIAEEKEFEVRLLVEHDAIVCTQLKNDDQRGFIFATWDKILIDVVEDVARVLADTPARIIDFLSMAGGHAFECEQNFELLTSLLYTDEKAVQKIAEKVDRIQSVEQAYRFSAFIDQARNKSGGHYVLKPEDVVPFLDNEPPHSSNDSNQ